MATILIVDDEEQICSMMRDLFELDGHRVLTANDGLEAEKVLDKGIDLAVVDIIMPHKTGIDFVNELRVSHPQMAVLLMSGGGSIKSDGPQVGWDSESARLIRKPFSGEEIRLMVNQMLGEGACSLRM